jgi:hypothetical protein
MTLTRQITLKEPLTEVQEINSWAVFFWVGRTRCHVCSACSTTLIYNADAKFARCKYSLMKASVITDPHERETYSSIHPESGPGNDKMIQIGHNAVRLKS